MALFSCGTLAHQQMVTAFAHLLNEWKLPPVAAADCLELRDDGDAGDQALRHRLIDGLSTLIDQNTGNYHGSVGKNEFQAVLERADLMGLFRNDRRDPRSVQLRAMLDIRDGLNVAGMSPEGRARLGIESDNPQAWVVEENALLGMPPCEIMGLGEKGTDLVACWTLASNGMIDAADVLGELPKAMPAPALVPAK